MNKLTSTMLILICLGLLLFVECRSSGNQPITEHSEEPSAVPTFPDILSGTPGPPPRQP